MTLTHTAALNLAHGMYLTTVATALAEYTEANNILAAAYIRIRSARVPEERRAQAWDAYETSRSLAWAKYRGIAHRALCKFETIRKQVAAT